MANNRMYLYCERCGEDEDTPAEACLFFLAKYYPSQGWYTRSTSGPFDDALNAWLDTHQHGDMFGEFIRLLYEGQFSEHAVTKRVILKGLTEAMK